MKATGQLYRQAELLLETTRFDPNEPEPDDKTVFRKNFKRIGSLGDYILITGKKSSGKTKYVAGGIAAAISAEEIFNFSIKLPGHKRRVLHIDSEQGSVSHYRMMQLIMKLSKFTAFPGNVLHSNRCRCVAPHLIKAMIEVYLDKHRDTGMIFLDGMLDTVESMNDEKEAAKMKRWMQETSEQHDVLIAGVIHRGFSADKSIGHIGSYLERGAQTVFAIEKKEQSNFTYYEIRTEFIRDDAPPPATGIFFNTGTNDWENIDPATVEIPILQAEKNKIPFKSNANAYDIQQHSANVRQIFNSTGLLSYEKLINRIVEVYGINKKYAKQDFYKHLLKEELIFDTGDGYSDRRQTVLYKTS